MTKAADTLRALKQAIRSHGYAWPGGYPMFALMDDGETMSIDAARDNFREICRATIQGSRDGWACVAVDINWEDGDMVCCHTGEPIECAYPADDDEETDDTKI